LSFANSTLNSFFLTKNKGIQYWMPLFLTFY